MPKPIDRILQNFYRNFPYPWGGEKYGVLHFGCNNLTNGTASYVLVRVTITNTTKRHDYSVSINSFVSWTGRERTVIKCIRIDTGTGRYLQTTGNGNGN